MWVGGVRGSRHVRAVYKFCLVVVSGWSCPELQIAGPILIFTKPTAKLIGASCPYDYSPPVVNFVDSRSMLRCVLRRYGVHRVFPLLGARKETKS